MSNESLETVLAQAAVHLLPLVDKPLTGWTAADKNLMAKWLMAIETASVKEEGRYPSLKEREKTTSRGPGLIAPVSFRSVIRRLPDQFHKLERSLASVNRYHDMAQRCWKILDA